MSERETGSSLQASVLVCTHNRPHLVSRAIQSLAATTLPQDRFEVILVDSASTLPPQEAIEIGEASFRCFRSVRLETPGISLARNTALAAARGRFAVYLDDDAMAPPNWLPTILAAFEQADPQPAVVAGPVISEYETPLPTWWPPEYERMLSAIPVQPSGFKTPETFDGFAANIAFDAERLRQAGGFSEKIGRVGGMLLGGEETLAIQDIFDAGGALYFCGTAPVQHFVASARLNEAWLLKRLWAEGYTVAAMYRLRGKLPPVSKMAKEAIKLAGGAANIVPGSARLRMAAAGRASYAKGFFSALSHGTRAGEPSATSA